MEHGKTLNAVFNDVVTITRYNERSFQTMIEGRPHPTFHNIDLTEDVEFQKIEVEPARLGTLVTFKRSLSQQFEASGDHYIRIRFELDERTHDLFSSEQSPSEGFLNSSFNRTELTEFRLNERRSFPDEIRQRISSERNDYFKLVTVHYFLMRDRQFELVEAHTHFRKMRLLEDDLWRHYLVGTPPGAGSVGREKAIRRVRNKILIYQWRVDADSTPSIKDFIAFANFRSPIPNLLIYAIVIVVLGGLGAAIDAILANIYKDLIPRIGYASPGDLTSHFVSAIFLVCSFLLILVGWRIATRFGRRIGRPPT
jgi:hypothetical protein